MAFLLNLKKLCPWLLAIHCLKLNVKYNVLAIYLTNVIKIQGEVNELFSKNPSRIHRFQELAMDLLHILNHLSKLTLADQYDDINILHALTILKQLYSSLASMIDGHFGDALSELLKCKVEMQGDGGHNDIHT
ncbi:hypothetical protein PR048_025838 [Dryococelus australis]|uniref:Uncharacterized protein n=1 Tax=Dryococelus australis TaxID=614101 RepID=A0ABQ9GJP0_9NEOP|nr:hypothetical protein PR048_025838 [Dryococelus australis]